MNNIKLSQFIKNNPIGVLSTLGPDGVSSAAVYYMLDDGNAIYINSQSGSEKIKNIKENSEVSFNVFQRDPAETLQVKGKAEIVEDITGIVDSYTELLHRSFQDGKIPPILQLHQGLVELIKITPTWMRFGSFSPEKGSEDTFATIIG